MSAYELASLAASISWLAIAFLAARTFWRVDALLTILVVLASLNYAVDFLTKGIAG